MLKVFPILINKTPKEAECVKGLHDLLKFSSFEEYADSFITWKIPFFMHKEYFYVSYRCLILRYCWIISYDRCTILDSFIEFLWISVFFLMAFCITWWVWKRINHTGESIKIKVSPRKALFDSLHCGTLSRPFRFMIAEGEIIWVMYWRPF